MPARVAALDASSLSAAGRHGPAKHDYIHWLRTRLLASVKSRALMEDSGMARRMRDKDFRDDQWARRYTGRVERINRFIDELGAKDGTGHPPYIPPMCGGADALALSISRDPGPKAGGTKGSGFLSIENDDPSAERMGQFLAEAGIDYAEVVPWNAYPWYINSDPTTDQLRAGVEPLRDLIGLMPRLRVVLVHGTAAGKAGSFSCVRTTT